MAVFGAETWRFRHRRSKRLLGSWEPFKDGMDPAGVQLDGTDRED